MIAEDSVPAAERAAASPESPQARRPPPCCPEAVKAGCGCKAKCRAKRERILRAAPELFADQDYHRVLMDDVAARASVGKGTLYRYFGTKEELFVAVLSFAVDVTTERLRAKIEKLDDPVEQLRVACRQTLRFFRENGPLFRVLNHSKALRCAKGRDDLNAKRKGLRHFVEDVIAAGREKGVFAADDPAFASTILWGMIRTALRNSPADVPLADKIVDLFAGGILKR